MKRILCWFGIHDWIGGLDESKNLVRDCFECNKRQQWVSAGFPAYQAEWVNCINDSSSHLQESE